MNTHPWIRTLLAALAGAVLAIAFVRLPELQFWKRSQGEVRSVASEEILVMRTRGGLLEVSRIRAVESFDTRFVYSVLGIEVGETVPRIRAPALYRYHVPLAPEWRVLRSGEWFTVVAPPVRPSLPVALDLAKLERQASGTWVLLPFTETAALDELQRQLTAKLAVKARSPAYVQLQREAARQTVTEFVRKWLLTQAQWQASARPRLRVYFADEPIGSLDAVVPLLRSSGQRAATTSEAGNQG